MSFTCGSIDIEGYKIFKEDQMRYYVGIIIRDDIKYAHEICEMLDPEWRKNIYKIKSIYSSYTGILQDFIMSFYDKVDLKQFV